MLPTKALKTGHRLYRFLTENANTSSQTLMRLTTFLLIFLVTISALFELDAVLGAFAAGFILRYIIPDGSKSLEMKLEGVGYGFLIPVFSWCQEPRSTCAPWQADPRCSSRSS